MRIKENINTPANEFEKSLQVLKIGTITTYLIFLSTILLIAEEIKKEIFLGSGGNPTISTNSTDKFWIDFFTRVGVNIQSVQGLVSLSLIIVVLCLAVLVLLMLARYKIEGLIAQRYLLNINVDFLVDKSLDLRWDARAHRFVGKTSNGKEVFNSTASDLYWKIVVMS